MRDAGYETQDTRRRMRDARCGMRAGDKHTGPGEGSGCDDRCARIQGEVEAKASSEPELGSVSYLVPSSALDPERASASQSHSRSQSQSQSQSNTKASCQASRQRHQATGIEREDLDHSKTSLDRSTTSRPTRPTLFARHSWHLQERTISRVLSTPHAPRPMPHDPDPAPAGALGERANTSQTTPWCRAHHSTRTPIWISSSRRYSLR